MAFDVFISYSSRDKTTAEAACAALESTGACCWIAPRDIRAGVEYAEGIIEGIDSCRIMVLIFSSNANASPQVHRELERAVSRGLTIIPFRIEDVLPSNAMEYYLSSIHWLDALTPPLAKHLEHLAEQVKANLQVEAANNATPVAAFDKLAATKTPSAGLREAASRSWPQWAKAGPIRIALISAVTALAAALCLVWYFSLPPALVITKSPAFGGSGGAAFDDTASNAKHQPISSLRIIVNLNPQDATQRIIGGLQVQWSNAIGPLHGGKGPYAQPETVVEFQKNEKIGRVDVNSMTYHYSPGPPPQWIAGLAIWTDSRVYTFGDMSFGQTNQCILAYGETLLGFFGRSGSYIDQIGCIIGKAK